MQVSKVSKDTIKGTVDTHVVDDGQGGLQICDQFLCGGAAVRRCGGAAVRRSVDGSPRVVFSEESGQDVNARCSQHDLRK